MIGYKKADGMKPVYLTKHLKEVHGEKWVGWCSHCGCLMTLEYPDGGKK